MLCLMSHPVWVRGLKREERNLKGEGNLSHPVWVRGLKQASARHKAALESRTLCGCVD